MNKGKALSIIKYVALLLITLQQVYADSGCLEVQPNEPQSGTYTCWAACADMLLHYYGNSYQQDQLWYRGTNNIDTGNGLCDLPNFDVQENVKSLLASGNQINVSASCTDSVTWGNLQNAISARIPIIASYEYQNEEDVIGHDVLILGWKIENTEDPEDPNHVLYNDPEDTGSTPEDMPYDAFRSNVLWLWEESLVPTSGSTVGKVPTGGFTGISITPSTIQFSYQGKKDTLTSGFYCSTNNCTTPTAWTWSLVFYYRGGNYLAVPSQNLNGYGASEWIIPAFNLPTTGYQWLYNEGGLITGLVQVNAGGYSACENVTYVPQNVFPGIVDIYNQSISGSKPEVDAHYCININNLIVNTGASIIFKAGSCFDIGTLNINNGSNVTFTIDPSLQ